MQKRKVGGAANMNYARIASMIIERSRSRPLPDIREWHHIIPTCVGGQNTEENLIAVTLKEHYILHHLLARLNPGIWEFEAALRIMSFRYHKRKKIRTYERLPKIHIEQVWNESLRGDQLRIALTKHLKPPKRPLHRTALPISIDLEALEFDRQDEAAVVQRILRQIREVL